MTILARTLLAALFLAGPAGPALSLAEETTAAPTTAEKIHLLAIAEDRRVSGRDELLASLDDADETVRARALLGFARLQDRATATWVLPALEDASAPVREMACFALGQIADTLALDPLANALADPVAAVREAATEALGKLDSPRAVGSLLALLADPDRAVAAEAVLALARLGRDGVGNESGRVAEAATRLLADPDPEIRWRAAFCLERLQLSGLGPETESGPRVELPAAAIRALERELRDPEPLPRLFAVKALGRARDGGRTGKKAPSIISLLGDEDWRVRVEAARALGRIKGNANVGALSDVLARWKPASASEAESAADWHLRAAALEALAEAKNPKGARAAELYLAHPSPGLRWRAARALVAMADKEHRPQLERAAALLEDPDWTVRSKTAAALGEGQLPEVTGILLARLDREKDSRVRAGLAEGLVATGSSTALAALMDLLADPDPIPSAIVAEGLTRFSGAVLVPALGSLLRNRTGEEWAEARLAAVGSLAALGGQDAVTSLEGALADPDEKVARQAAEGIRRLTGREVVPSTSAAAPQEKEYAPTFGEDAPGKRAILRTSRGEIEFELAGGAWEATTTVTNFVWLAEQGYFDGLVFHRVVPDFVIQTGSPEGDGWGGPGYTIRCEINRRRYGTGAVGMALSGKDTGGSQFFITHSPQPRLDGRYTIFGQVVRGQDVVDAIREGDVIESVLVQ